MVMKEGTKTITFRVDSETKFAIEMAAHAENRSVNNWITNIIKNYLKEQKNNLKNMDAISNMKILEKEQKGKK